MLAHPLEAICVLPEPRLTTIFALCLYVAPRVSQEYKLGPAVLHALNELLNVRLELSVPLSVKDVA